MLVLHHALRRRAVRLVLDLICVALATGGAVAFAAGSLAVEPNRDKPFLQEAFDVIRTAGIEWNHMFVLKETAMFFLSESDLCSPVLCRIWFRHQWQIRPNFQELCAVAILVRESYAPIALYAVLLCPQFPHCSLSHLSFSHYLRFVSRAYHRLTWKQLLLVCL